MSVLDDPQGFLDRTARWTAALAAGGAGLAALLWDWRVGLGIALGALLAHVNLMLIARTLSEALGRAAGSSAAAEATEAPISGGSRADDASGREGDVPPSAHDDPPPSASDTAKREGARVRALGLLRLPFVVLALVLILWYMPARPEGVALGVTLSLAAAVLAALRAENQRSAPSA